MGGHREPNNRRDEKDRDENGVIDAATRTLAHDS